MNKVQTHSYMHELNLRNFSCNFFKKFPQTLATKPILNHLLSIV